MLQLTAIFVSVFLAEFGDKTQLATLLFASDQKTSPLLVFLASAGALCLSSAIAVAAGTYAGRYLEGVPLRLFAGIGFIIIGIWTIVDHWRSLPS